MSQSLLSATDIRIASLLRKVEVFQDISEDNFHSPNGTVCVMCPDGDRSADILRHHSLKCKCSRHHPLALNGGAILMARTKKTRNVKGFKTRGDVLMQDLEVAMKLKGFKAITLIVHAPCGVAYGQGFNLMDVIELLMTAKRRVRERFGPLPKIFPLCHVAFPDDRHRTYFVNRDNWNDLLTDPNGQDELKDIGIPFREWRKVEKIPTEAG